VLRGFENVTHSSEILISHCTQVIHEFTRVQRNDTNCNIFLFSAHSVCKFEVHGSVHRKHIFKYNQQDATLQNLFIFCEMLYMFQAVPPTIIRSSKLYIQHRVLCQTFTATCYCRGR